MLFSVAAIILILAITFYQAVHGLFSSFIMMILTIVSAVLAIGLYEELYYGFVRAYLREYGEAVTVMALFVVWLLLLRTLFDQMIPGNMILPVAADRVGGAVCGLVTALFTVGMLAIGFQLLPFDASILGFERIKEKQRRKVAGVFNPDGVAINVFSYLSANALSGKQPFRDFHPDFLLELHASRTVPKESVHRVPVNTLHVGDTWKLGNVVKSRKPGGGLKPRNLPRNAEWRVVRAQLSGGTDSDGRHRFTGYSWRLVGVDAKGRIAEFYATALKRAGKSAERGRYVAFEEGEFVTPLPGDYKHFNLAFQVPTGFVPKFLEYKRTSRVAISPLMLESDEPPLDERPKPRPRPKPSAGKRPPAKTSPPPKPTPQKPSRSEAKPDKKTGTITASRGGTSPRHPFKAVKTDEIPVFLASSAYATRGAEVAGPVFRSGHVTAELPKKLKVKIGTVQKFWVPDGQVMLQISTEPSRARSVLGKAMTFAKRTVMQWRVIDGNNRQYWPLGEVRIARRDGAGRVEIQYRPQMANSMPERALEPSISVNENQLLSPGSEVIFLYLVPRDAEIVSFKAQDREYPITF